jgi:hypothetical protein
MGHQAKFLPWAVQLHIMANSYKVWHGQPVTLMRCPAAVSNSMRYPQAVHNRLGFDILCLCSNRPLLVQQ